MASVSWPFFGTRAGFRVSVAVCFAGWEMTWSFPTPGTSTVGRRPRALTCGSRTTSGTRFTPAIGSFSAKNIPSHSASVRSRDLAAARAVSRPERRQDGQRGVEAARQIPDRNARDRGSAFVAVPRDGQDPRERFEIDVVAREVLVWTVLPVPGERTVDQLRIPHREPIVVRPEAGHDAGSELLDHHVRAADQLPKDLLALGGLQIDREGPLSAVHHRERVRDVVDDRRNRAHVVAQLRVLDLDDVGTEIAQELRAERAREETREIQERDPIEGRRHGVSKWG